MIVQAGDINIDLLPVGTAFVRLEFSKLNVSIGSLSADVALGNRKDNLNQVLGSFYLGGLEMEMNGSVNIHPPSACTQGIVLDYDANFPKFTLSALSWGNADGFGGTSTAGYRGWRDMTISGLSIAGPLSINVATLDSNMVSLLMTSQMSPTFVQLGIGTGNANDDPAGTGFSRDPH